MFGVVGMQRACRREISRGQTVDLLNNLIVSGNPKPNSGASLHRLRAIFTAGKRDERSVTRFGRCLIRGICCAIKSKD
jgi:hypothetical protein